MNKTANAQWGQTEKLNRRSFLKHLSAAGALLLPSCISSRPPNIVLIISDDQGWDDYGFSGHPVIRTPHLDQLASQSVVFTRAYVAAPLCCPSLASIITGLHPHQHSITSNDPPYTGSGDKWPVQNWSEERKELRNEMIRNFQQHHTLPEQLQELGYKSLQTGKWWMGDYRNGGFTHGMTHGDMQRGGRHGDDGLNIGRKSMQPIYDFLDHADNQPFFLWYAPFLPHRPHNPPERFLRKYLERTSSEYFAKYAATCEWFDETCGDLLDALERRGLTQNTLILYVCDNGWIQKPDAPDYAERSKRSPYEGGVRTPIMLKWPGHTEPELNTRIPVSSIDLAPTVLAACGLQPLNALQGVNLLDREALESRGAVFGAAYTHDAVDINDPASSLKYSYVITRDWKLIQASGRNGAGTLAQLYAIQRDPEEKENLADQYPDIAAQLQDKLRGWWPAAVPL